MEIAISPYHRVTSGTLILYLNFRAVAFSQTHLITAPPYPNKFYTPCWNNLLTMHSDYIFLHFTPFQGPPLLTQYLFPPQSGYEVTSKSTSTYISSFFSPSTAPCTVCILASHFQTFLVFLRFSVFVQVTFCFWCLINNCLKTQKTYPSSINLF